MSKQTQLIHSSNEPLFSVFGPLQQFLVEPAEASGAFAVMRAMVPPGIAIPLHSHADPEVLFVLDGMLQFLRYDADSFQWLAAGPGDVVSIPGHVKHALRNSSPTLATVLLATTPNIYNFFRELGKPFEADQPARPPAPEDMQRLLALAAKYNYWMASPQENAAIGLAGF